jgi:hypothetical protein
MDSAYGFNHGDCSANNCEDARGYREWVRHEDVFFENNGQDIMEAEEYATVKKRQGRFQLTGWNTHMTVHAARDTCTQLRLDHDAKTCSGLHCHNCSVLNPCMLRFKSGNGLWCGQSHP